ncbi:MAG: ABC transporter permease [Spirochaetaceae bacterium]|nr:MAG: ABC transporter permease [Spirochaetaceae bacterium]
MRVDWILFVARRHFRTRRREKGHAAALLSVTGLSVGVMTLVAVLAVMNGFQLNTIESILEVNSYHLRLEPGPSAQMPAQLRDRLAALPGVTTVLPFVEVQSLGRGVFGEPQAVMLRGVPWNATELDPGLAEHLQLTRGSFDVSGVDSVVLGAELARALGVGVGDQVSFLSLSGGELDMRRPREAALRVTGLFRTGFLDYDRGWGFISLDAAADVFEVDDRPIWGIKLGDRFADRRVGAQVTALVNEYGVDGEVISWREYNRSIFGALRVEKLMMSFLIGLIFVVVGANIFQALRRSVLERSEEIAVLKALGAPPHSVQLVFIIEGLMIGLGGGLIGMAAGLALSVNINEVFAFAEVGVNAVADLLAIILWPLGIHVGADFTIFSPTYFYIMEVPSHVFFWEAAGIFLFALLSAGLAALAASTRITRIRPAEVLRYQ